MAKAIVKSESKSKSKNGARPVADRDPAREPSFAYTDRVAPITDTLKRLGGSANVRELFAALQKNKSAAALFAKPRRINATWRQRVRLMESPPWLFENGEFRLRKRTRAATNGKSGRVSKRATRNAAA